MSLTTDDFEEFLASDPEDDETVPLGDALAELAVDVEVDSVATRNVRSRRVRTRPHVAHSREHQRDHRAPNHTRGFCDERALARACASTGRASVRGHAATARPRPRGVYP